MKSFLQTLQFRNETLFYFGGICFILALILFVISRFSQVEIAGVNAWYKPIKFALSIGIYAWTMAWLCFYVKDAPGIRFFSWMVIVTLGFEIIYIVLQASKGQLSHFNISTPFYGLMYNLMAMAATAVSLGTAYIGILFFTREFPQLPDYYLWAIRIGVILFVVFSLEGFVMGARMSHTIGGPDGETGLAFLNWSRKYGDPRIAHFIGMHALQVLPLLSFYVLRNVKLTLFVGALYAVLAVYVLLQALQGIPLIKS